jgi:hypothetical protein
MQFGDTADYKSALRQWRHHGGTIQMRIALKRVKIKIVTRRFFAMLPILFSAEPMPAEDNGLEFCLRVKASWPQQHQTQSRVPRDAWIPPSGTGF